MRPDDISRIKLSGKITPISSVTFAENNKLCSHRSTQFMFYKFVMENTTQRNAIDIAQRDLIVLFISFDETNGWNIVSIKKLIIPFFSFIGILVKYDFKSLRIF